MNSALIATLLAATLQMAGAASTSQDLSGTWRFQLDRADFGLREQWFKRSLPDSIHLPGSLPAQGIGDAITTNTHWTGGIVDKSWFTAPEYAPYREPGNIKVPFWLQPTTYYAGAAWYQRSFKVPRKWQGQRVVLTLERPHWQTMVWVDGQLFGTNNSLSAPQEYDLGTRLAPGKHQLTIRVDNRLVVDVGENSHCISDHTQGNWNGIVGDIRLTATAPVWLEDLQVYPHIATHSVTVKGRIGNVTGQAGEGQVSLVCERIQFEPDPHPLRKTLNVSWAPDGGTFEEELSLPQDTRLWDEFTPVCSKLTAALSRGQVVAQASGLRPSQRPSGSPTTQAGADAPPTQRVGGTSASRRLTPLSTRTVVFGLREVSTDGSQLLINGHKAFIRGTLECCIFPLTGHPPTDVDSWRRIIRIAKAHGLNLLRFHSYCPPEAAFVAGDELGMYFQIETCWANQSTTLGDGKPVDAWVYQESDHILKAYGSHPCFLLMPYGNEPGGKNATPYLSKWVAHYKSLDSRHLFTSGSGWPQIPENQFHVTPDPRIQGWGEGLKSRINAKPPETTTDYRDYIGKRTVPVISHEIGQWCVYPNLDEIASYTGYLKARNFEIFRDTLRAHGMGKQAHDFLIASGKLQTLCYKEDIESALRTPGMGGFELLDLHDFPGQGTALVGVLDPFWRDKGYVTAEEYSRFCNYTVPLARLSKRVFTTDEQLDAGLEVAHFGPAPLQSAETTWKLVSDSGKVVASGKLAPQDIPLGNGTTLGRLNLLLTEVPAPARYKLVVDIHAKPWHAYLSSRAGEYTVSTPDVFENDWDIWVYPSHVDTEPRPQVGRAVLSAPPTAEEAPSATKPSVLIVHELNDQTVAALNNGAKVLLLIPPSQIKGDAHGKVGLGFSSIFWNTAWTGHQLPHTLGILCDPSQGAFAEFPTDAHSNWQWWYLINRSRAMILTDLPQALHPTVQVIDDWVTNRKLGLLFEAKVGQGKVMVCSIDLDGDLSGNPVARQLRRSLLDYMDSSKFSPSLPLTPTQLQSLTTEPSAVSQAGK